MAYKKDLPLSVLEAIRPLHNRNSLLYTDKGGNDFYIKRFEDSDPESQFHFEVTTYRKAGSQTSFKIKIQPASAELPIATTRTLRDNELLPEFETWEKNLYRYAEQPDPFKRNNNQEAGYTRRIFEKLNVNDDSPEDKFDNATQQVIQQSLSRLKTVLESPRIVEKHGQQDEIIEEIDSLLNADNAAHIPKKAWKLTISNIYAKLILKGPDLMNDLKDVMKKELMKKTLYAVGGEVEGMIETLWNIFVWFSRFKGIS